MQAENEAPVTSVGLSPDGLRIALGTESGAVGVLDIATHCHATLLRSHTGPVNVIAASPKGDQFCTASSDSSIRVWSFSSCAQLYQFDAPHEGVQCATYHPSGAVIAAGFEGGYLRLFDIPNTTLLQVHDAAL